MQLHGLFCENRRLSAFHTKKEQRNNRQNYSKQVLPSGGTHAKEQETRGLVKRGNVLAWLKHLEHAPLYVASVVRIDWSRLGVFDDDDAADCEGERAQGRDDADDIETVPENIDLDDPVQLAIALNAMSKTIFFNEEGEQRPRALLMRDDGERSGELDDAAAADKLID
ncbi:hypothetical protein MRX96_054647 [Rhipicephalus microplus]